MAKYGGTASGGRLRHDDPSIMLRVYAHVINEQLAEDGAGPSRPFSRPNIGSEPSRGEQVGPVDRVQFLPLGFGEPDLG
jgi:hypothetical protein